MADKRQRVQQQVDREEDHDHREEDDPLHLHPFETCRGRFRRSLPPAPRGNGPGETARAPGEPSARRLTVMTTTRRGDTPLQRLPFMLPESASPTPVPASQRGMSAALTRVRNCVGSEP
jgi:hypothetical protein